jgi:hypothetical protein
VTTGLLAIRIASRVPNAVLPGIHEVKLDQMIGGKYLVTE